MSEQEILEDARYEIVDEEEEEQTGVDGITEQVLQRPDMLAALQGRLHAEMLEVMDLKIFFQNLTCVMTGNTLFAHSFACA